jgi:hypothetical protein
MVCPADGLEAPGTAVELERLLDDWSALMDRAVGRLGAVTTSVLRGGAGEDTLRAAEREVLMFEMEARAIQDRIVDRAAGSPNEAAVLARLLKRCGEQTDWDTEALPPHVVRRLVEVAAGEG